MKIIIDDVKIGNRYRKDLGDLKELAESIKEQGLLQPIGINEEKELIFGLRRIEAVKTLGWTEIDARRVNVTSIIEGELTENEMRKNFDLDERVAIGKEIEKMLGERRGGDHKSKEYQTANIGGLKKETRDIAAKKAGFGSHGNYEKAKVVSEKATEAQKEKLKTGKTTINAVYNDVKREEHKDDIEPAGKKVDETKAVDESKEKAERIFTKFTSCFEEDLDRILVAIQNQLGIRLIAIEKDSKKVLFGAEHVEKQKAK